jgi:hypothetical protein
MMNPIRMPKRATPAFTNGVHDDGHADVGVEAVAALRKRTGGKIGYLEQLQANGADQIHRRKGTQRGSDQVDGTVVQWQGRRRSSRTAAAGKKMK